MPRYLLKHTILRDLRRNERYREWNVVKWCQVAGKLELGREAVMSCAAAPDILMAMTGSVLGHYHQLHFSPINMSTAAKLTLGGTILGTIGIVILVHRQQRVDQAV